MAHRFEVVLGGALRAIDLLDRVTDQGGERSTSPQRGGIQGTPLLVGQRDLSSLHDVSLHHSLSGLEHLEAFPHVRRVRIRETFEYERLSNTRDSGPLRRLHIGDVNIFTFAGDGYNRRAVAIGRRICAG